MIFLKKRYSQCLTRLKGGIQKQMEKSSQTKSSGTSTMSESETSLAQENQSLRDELYLHRLMDEKSFRATLLTQLQVISNQLVVLTETIEKISSGEETPKTEEESDEEDDDDDSDDDAPVRKK